MKGYAVVTSDEQKAGHVVDEVGDLLIVEHGTLRKSRRPLPRAFAHVDDVAQVVRATVPRAVLEDAPELESGEPDLDAVARHYGLAGPDPDPATHGYGDVLPDDPAEPAPDDAELRARIGENQAPGEGKLDSGTSEGFLGGDRFRDADA